MTQTIPSQAFMEAVDKFGKYFQRRGIDIVKIASESSRFYGFDEQTEGNIVVSSPELRQWRGIVGVAYSLDNYSPIEKRKGFIQQLFGQLDFETALEVGCNVGNNLQVLHDMGKQVYGIDPLEVALEDKPWGNAVATAFGLPFASKQFDLVLCAGVLCHIAPTRLHAALAEIIQVSGRYVVIIDYPADKESVDGFRGTNTLWKRDVEKHADSYSTLNKVAVGLTEQWDRRGKMKYMVWERNMTEQR